MSNQKSKFADVSKTIRSFSIAPTLAVSVGLLVFLSVGLVLAIQWSTSQRIMSNLGGMAAARGLKLIESGIEHHLDPV